MTLIENCASFNLITSFRTRCTQYRVIFGFSFLRGQVQMFHYVLICLICEWLTSLWFFVRWLFIISHSFCVRVSSKMMSTVPSIRGTIMKDMRNNIFPLSDVWRLLFYTNHIYCVCCSSELWSFAAYDESRLVPFTLRFCRQNGSTRQECSSAMELGTENTTVDFWKSTKF